MSVVLLFRYGGGPGPSGSVAIVESADASNVVSSVTSSGQTAIVERIDVATTLSQISSVAAAAIREYDDLILAISRDASSGFGTIGERHDIVTAAATVTGTGNAAIVEFHDNALATATVTIKAHAAIVERPEGVSNVLTGALAVISGGSTPVETNVLTINVNTSAGGNITKVRITFNPNVTNRADAIRVLLGELDRGVNLSTLANSTFN